MANFLGDTILYLHELGFFTVFLPFLLIYVVLYGLLQKVQIFGKGDYTNYNALFSFAVAFFSVYNFDLTRGLPIFLSRIGLLFIFIVVVTIVAGFVGGHEAFRSDKARPYIMGAVAVYLALIVIEAFFSFEKIFRWLNRTFDWGVLIPGIVALAIFGGIVFYITQGGDSGKSKKSGTKKEVKSEPKKEEKPKEEKPKEEKSQEVVDDLGPVDPATGLPQKWLDEGISPEEVRRRFGRPPVGP